MQYTYGFCWELDSFSWPYIKLILVVRTIVQTLVGLTRVGWDCTHTNFFLQEVNIWVDVLIGGTFQLI